MPLFSTINSILFKLTGLDEKLIEKSSDHFKRQAATQGIIMLFTSVIGAALAGFSLGSVFKSWSAGLLLTLILIPLIYLAERATTTNLGRPGRLNWTLRIALFLGIVGLNMVSVDLIIFHKEIHEEAYNRFDQQRSDSIMIIESQIVATQADQEAKSQEIKAVKDTMATHLRSIDLEVDGTEGTGLIGVGEVSKYKQATFDALQITYYDPTIARYQEEYEELSTALNNLRSEGERIMAKQFQFDKLGPGAQLAILHDLAIKKEGKAILLMLFVVFFLAGVCDFLPIIHRDTMDFAQYRKAHDEHVKLSVAKVAALHAVELKTIKTISETEMQLLDQQREAAEKSRPLRVMAEVVENEAQSITRIYQAKLKAVRLLGKMHSSAFESLSFEAQRVIEEAYLDALALIDELTGMDNLENSFQ